MSRGRFDFSDGTKGARFRVLHSNGSIGLHIASDRRIDRIDLENTAAAEGPKLPSDQVRIQLTAQQAAPDANEIYTAHFALVRETKTEPVFNSRVEYVAGPQVRRHLGSRHARQSTRRDPRGFRTAGSRGHRYRQVFRPARCTVSGGQRRTRCSLRRIGETRAAICCRRSIEAARRVRRRLRQERGPAEPARNRSDDG